MKKIILVGYMGSGKSTIGKLLADKINFSSYDLDVLIEKEENLSVSEIFEQKGELYFRKLEHEILVSNLKKNQSFVLSLGGGTPCYYNNHELLTSKDVISIYLKASIETIFDRLKSENTTRPLISNLNDTDKKEFIAKHLFERSFFYNHAKYSILVDGKSPEMIVTEIQKLLL
jgi:shikimate kinase